MTKSTAEGAPAAAAAAAPARGKRATKAAKGTEKTPPAPPAPSATPEGMMKRAIALTAQQFSLLVQHDQAVQAATAQRTAAIQVIVAGEGVDVDFHTLGVTQDKNGQRYLEILVPKPEQPKDGGRRKRRRT